MRAAQWIDRSSRRVVVGVGVLAASAAGLALSGGPAVGQARAVPAPVSRPGPTADPGFPAFVHLPADQAAHPGAQNEWWYTIGHLTADGHEYGYEVQLTAQGLTQIALTDLTSGTYASQQNQYRPGQFSVSATALDVRMPNASLSGPPGGMHLTADLPHEMGTLDLTLAAAGPAMYDNGTGLFPFLGGTSYYYSLPDLATSGTLTLGGKATRVRGISWLDRQWGDWNWASLHKWTWMAVQLGNGQALNLWDLFDSNGEGHWATVLSPDGSERVVSVSPLAPGASSFQTSPATGQRYAGQWIVEIPGLHARLTVIARPVLQEILYGSPLSPGINESDSTVRGTYLGHRVTGHAYVEQLGIWK
jgi:predicted secreted hydrolase